MKLTKYLFIANVAAFLVSIAVSGLSINLNWLGIISPDVDNLIHINWVAHPGNVNLIPLFTSLFLHIGIIHLGLNLLMIWYIGDLDLNPMVLLLVYVISGMIGNFIAVIVDGIAVLGASTAIMGVLGFEYIKSRDKEILLIILLTIIPCLFLPGISNGAHVGGLIVGMMCSVPAKFKQLIMKENYGAH